MEATITPTDSVVTEPQTETEEIERPKGKTPQDYAMEFHPLANLFPMMMDKELTANPFASKKLPSTVRGNADRFHMVTRSEIGKLIDQETIPEMKLLLALIRFGGLRSPSETLSLTWDCVDWEHDRMTIISPKTANHEGKGSRVVPLFPELRVHLQAAFDAAPAGASKVIMRYITRAGMLLRIEKIAKQAGVTVWGKFFQNCRASRQCELTEIYPIHVVCAWMGNSPAIAAKNYLHEIESYFDKATAQNATQQPAQSNQNEAQPEKKSRNPILADQARTTYNSAHGGLMQHTEHNSKTRSGSQMRKG